MQLNPVKEKYWGLYMGIAQLAAKSSYCTKLKVGACIVTPEGMLSIGWNGTPAGYTNICEFEDFTKDPVGLTTYPYVIHAEANAIYKMLRTGHSTRDSVVFTTHAPCLACASLIHNADISRVIYLNDFSHDEGVNYLNQSGIYTGKLFND